MVIPADRLSFLINSLHQLIRTELDTSFPPLGLSLPKYAVLAGLNRVPGASNADLTRNASISPQSMGELVRALEEQGLIVRTSDSKNASILRTTLTPKGNRALKDGSAEITRVEGHLTGGLSPGEAKDLHSLLERCIATLRREEAAPTPQAPAARLRRPIEDPGRVQQPSAREWIPS